MDDSGKNKLVEFYESKFLALEKEFDKIKKENDKIKKEFNDYKNLNIKCCDCSKSSSSSSKGVQLKKSKSYKMKTINSLSNLSSINSTDSSLNILNKSTSSSSLSLFNKSTDSSIFNHSIDKKDSSTKLNSSDSSTKLNSSDSLSLLNCSNKTTDQSSDSILMNKTIVSSKRKLNDNNCDSQSVKKDKIEIKYLCCNQVNLVAKNESIRSKRNHLLNNHGTINRFFCVKCLEDGIIVYNTYVINDIISHLKSSQHCLEIEQLSDFELNQIYEDYKIKKPNVEYNEENYNKTFNPNEAFFSCKFQYHNQEFCINFNQLYLEISSNYNLLIENKKLLSRFKDYYQPVRDKKVGISLYHKLICKIDPDLVFCENNFNLGIFIRPDLNFPITFSLSYLIDNQKHKIFKFVLDEFLLINNSYGGKKTGALYCHISTINAINLFRSDKKFSFLDFLKSIYYFGMDGKTLTVNPNTSSVRSNRQCVNQRLNDTYWFEVINNLHSRCLSSIEMLIIKSIKLGLDGNLLQGESFSIFGWKSNMCEVLAASFVYLAFEIFSEMIEKNHGQLPKEFYKANAKIETLEV